MYCIVKVKCFHTFDTDGMELLRTNVYFVADMMKMPDPQSIMAGGEPNVGIFIDDHKRRADHDPNAPPFDDLRNYAYEGGGSTAGSLSSLASGTFKKILNVI